MNHELQGAITKLNLENISSRNEILNLQETNNITLSSSRPTTALSNRPYSPGSANNIGKSK